MLLDRLEAVTVRINYGDILRETAKYNAAIFDRWLIVTEASDEETREVCRQFSLPVLLSEDGKSAAGDGGDFNKGKLVERGLRMLGTNAWKVHIDADIVLPTRTRHFLEISELDKCK